MEKKLDLNDAKGRFLYKKKKKKKKRFSRKKSFGRINFRGQLLLLYFTGSNFRVNTPNSGNSRYFLSQKFLHVKYSTQHVLHMLLSCLYFHLILWISSVMLSTKFDNDFAINLALSQKFVILMSFAFLSMLLTSFVIQTKRLLYFSVFCPRQLISPSNFYVSSYMIKW